MKELMIKDICTKCSSNLKQKDVEELNGEYPVYGASGLINHINFYHQEKQYIAIVKDGSGIGRVGFYPAKSSVIGTMQYILPKEDFDIKYIGYCLQSLDLTKYKQGAAIPHIYFRDYGERKVKIEEDKSKQEEIVRYLDKAFMKIDAMKEKAEEALEEAKALFQSALTEMMTPKEGREMMIKEICTKGSSNLKQKDVEGLTGEYPVYGAGGLINHVDFYHQEKQYIAIVKDGSGIGRVDFYPAKSSIIGTMQYILPKDGFDIKYIGYCLQSLDLTKYKQGAAIPHIYFRDYGERKVKVELDLRKQKEIVRYLDEIQVKVNAIKGNITKTIAECDAMKQAILRKVFE